jgi:excisionase family DNA binding protein
MYEKPLVLTVREVSLLLRIRRAKVYILIETGCLLGSKVGGDWRIRTESVEDLIGELPEWIFEGTSRTKKEAA